MFFFSLIGAALLILARAEAASSEAAPFVLVRDGVAQCSVVVEEPMSAEVGEAVEELNLWVGKITGTTLPVVASSRWDGSSPYIAVGGGELPRRNGWSVGALGPEGARVVVEPGRIGLLGRDDPGRPELSWLGSYYAVLEFVRHSLGVRWIWPGELGEVYTRRATLEAAPAAWTWETPLLLKRDLRGSHNQGRRNGAARMGLGISDEEWQQRAAEEARWRRRMRVDNRRPTFYRSGHSFTKWWDRYGEKHPDWFARPPVGAPQMKPALAKLNLVNAAVQATIVENWRKEWQADPVANRFLRLARNDGSGYDTRPEARAWDAPALRELSDEQVWRAGRDINLSDRYVRFWNLIAAEVAAIDPAARVSVYAYGAQQHPPLREKRLADNIVIEYTGGEGHYPDEQPPLLRQWKGWRALGARSIIWRPNLFHAGRGISYLHAETLHRDMQYFLRNGCEGIDFDSLTGNWAGQGLNYYVAAELVSRPEAEYETLANEYFGAFGAAAQAVGDYHRHWAEVTREAPARGRESRILSPSGGWGRWSMDYIRMTPLLLTDQVLEKAEALLEKAEALADTEIARRRVEVLRQAFELNRLEARVFGELRLHRRVGWVDVGTFRESGDVLKPLWDARFALIHNPYLPVAGSFLVEQARLKLWDGLLAPERQSVAEATTRVVPLIDGWTFHSAGKGEGLPGDSEEGWQPVADGRKVETGGEGVVYRISFPTPEMGDHDGQVQLRLEAVEGEARLWLNGDEIRSLESIQSGELSLDIRRWLLPEGNNRLTIRVEDAAANDGLVRGVSLRIEE
ncbi:MAG TPA: DUF4838 domain-containing protein [Chthoniobacteraceae bacterium]|nr:DUF4838 domain-containing protein [Chthoniobacteraceae bacterium]